MQSRYFYFILIHFFNVNNFCFSKYNFLGNYWIQITLALRKRNEEEKSNIISWEKFGKFIKEKNFFSLNLCHSIGCAILHNFFSFIKCSNFKIKLNSMLSGTIWLFLRAIMICWKLRQSNIGKSSLIRQLLG